MLWKGWFSDMSEVLKTPAKRVVGTKQILKKFAKDDICMLFVADNAQESLRQSLLSLARDHGAEVISVRTMEDLGKLCGIEVGAAAAGVLK